MNITRVQKKELANTFNGSGLQMSQFIWPLGEADFYLKHKYDFHSFAVNRVSSDEYELSYTQTHSPELVQRKKIWAKTVLLFKGWCGSLFEELTTVTGWENIENTRMFGGSGGDINAPISDVDKVFYREGLLFMAEQVQDLGLLTEDQFGILNKKLDELNDKVDTLSRFDWEGLCLGTVAGLIQFFVLPPDAAGLFWMAAQNAFNNFRLR